MTPAAHIDTALAAALTDFNAGRHAEAEAACRRMLAGVPPQGAHPAVLQLLALLLHQRGEQREALTLIARSLALRPRHGAALLIAGRIRRALGDLAGAADDFQQALKLAPGASEPAYLFGATLLELGHPSAPVALRYLLELHPGHAGGWQQLGLALKQQGDNTAALEAFARAAALAPASGEIAFHHGLLLRETGALEDAAAALRRSAGLQSGAASPSTSALGTPEAWYHLGLVYQDQRQAGLAAQAFRQALTGNPGHAEAAFNLGIALQESGDIDGAITAYRAALRLRPSDFGRIAQALSAGAHGRLWLDLNALRAYLSVQAPPVSG
jgi:tetratricopeptide (TPR) repeat protein